MLIMNDNKIEINVKSQGSIIKFGNFFVDALIIFNSVDFVNYSFGIYFIDEVSTSLYFLSIYNT